MTEAAKRTETSLSFPKSGTISLKLGKVYAGNELGGEKDDGGRIPGYRNSCRDLRTDSHGFDASRLQLDLHPRRCLRI